MLSPENELWIFDYNHLKDATTLLTFNNLHEKNEHDLELKKLISLQFGNESDMKAWAMNLFDKVSRSIRLI